MLYSTIIRCGCVSVMDPADCKNGNRRHTGYTGSFYGPVTHVTAETATLSVHCDKTKGIFACCMIS